MGVVMPSLACSSILPGSGRGANLIRLGTKSLEEVEESEDSTCSRGGWMKILLEGRERVIARDSGQGCHILYLSRCHPILIVIKHFNTSTHTPKTPSSPVNLSKSTTGVWPRLLQKRGPKAMLSSVRIVVIVG